MKKNKTYTDVYLVICREPGDYGYGHYDFVELVTLDYNLATKFIEDNKDNSKATFFIETHNLLKGNKQ